MRTSVVLPGVVGICSATLALVLTSPHGAATSGSDGTAVPEQLAGYSHLTGSVSGSPPGRAVALYQHGFGVELLDRPQAVVLGAGGDVYRRVDAAEDRAGPETQGDPAPMLLSPDGTKVAVGDHDVDRPDVVVVDLTTGATTTRPLPTGRSVVPVAWSQDSTVLATLLSPAPTNPYSGERITGEVGLLDLGDDTAVVLPDDAATAVAFSPDGSQVAVERAAEGEVGVSVIDLGTGDRRPMATDGLLAGPTAWSPDGRLLAITTVEPSGSPAGVGDPGTPTGLAFLDPAGQGGEVPAPLDLPLAGPGRVLGWTDSGEVMMLLHVAGHDPCCGADSATLSGVPLDGAEPRTVMRIRDLQSHGVGRFQMAGATVGDLRVVSPSDVDRGGWPLPLRSGLAFLVGLAAWLVTRTTLRRRGRVRDRSR